MPVSPARAFAFDILIRIEREQSYATELLHADSGKSLSEQDHGLATEIVMGVLRWRLWLDDRIAEFSSQKLGKLDLEVLTALRIASYQLVWLNRVPARAAIYESVELVKRARKRSSAPFVNAVLRKLAENKLPIPAPTNPHSSVELAVKLAHPQWLVERWVAHYGSSTAAEICHYDQTVPETTIRLRHPEIEEQLTREGIRLAPGALLSSARKVIAGDITHTPSFRKREVIIQDEASQLVAALLGEGESVLDCCAAPGGKTRVIAERNPQAEITALELHPHRARLMRNLLPPESNGNIRIAAGDARMPPFSAKFDRILTDVPCSGTGTLARNPEIKWRLQPSRLDELHELQITILRSALAQLERGGRLVYSTCSLEPEENEKVVERIAAEDKSLIIRDCGSEIKSLRDSGELVWANLANLTRGPYLRTLLGTHPCEGFFAAILEKGS